VLSQQVFVVWYYAYLRCIRFIRPGWHPRLCGNPSACNIDPIFYTGVLLIIVGLCFKVGAAPFHFWTPDVYEGAPSLITAYMSTVVKAAGFAAFLRLFSASFSTIASFWSPVLMVITIITLFIGNITALYQQSFKRMLAFSSISHAGYLLFAIVALGAASQIRYLFMLRLIQSLLLSLLALWYWFASKPAAITLKALTALHAKIHSWHLYLRWHAFVGGYPFNGRLYW
jgi:NADH:ubiquinone oxidoreductase subunit 2 (subunit N)